MDTLQIQLNALSSKVDDLHQLVEQLSIRVSEIVSDCRLGSESKHQAEFGGGVGHSYSRTIHGNNLSLEHKDILIDEDSIDHTFHVQESQLSPEIQIQRLTAQLTAAYSRIAALEEQLIAKRIH